MRVLYLAPDVVPAPKGAAVRIARTVSTLRDLGHRVDVLTPGAGSPNFLRRMLDFRAEASSWLADREADVVQFRSIWEGVPAIAWARRTGTRAVFEAHGFPSVELVSRLPGLERHRVLDKIIAEERLVVAASDRIQVPSITTARFAQRLGAAPGRIAVMPNAVDPAMFSPAPVAPADEPPYRLVYMGTLAPWQGIETLLEAMALLSGSWRGAGMLELHVLGPRRSAWAAGIRQLARRLRIHQRVRLSGPVAQADLVPALRTAHLCVAPLAADARNVLQGCCPLKLLEYMACGRPILSTAIAPVEEIVDHEVSAYLVRPGSAAALASGIAWMLEHRDEREQLGVRARDAVLRRFTPEHFRERTRRFMAELAPTAPAPLSGIGGG